MAGEHLQSIEVKGHLRDHDLVAVCSAQTITLERDLAKVTVVVRNRMLEHAHYAGLATRGRVLTADAVSRLLAARRRPPIDRYPRLHLLAALANACRRPTTAPSFRLSAWPCLKG